MSFDITHNLLYSYSRFVFIVQFSMCKRPFGLGGLKWTRTTDLTIISRVL